MAEKICVKVPASTANLGPGFDALGMALNLYEWIEMGASDRTTIQLHGDRLEGVAADKSNLVYQVAQRVFREAGVSIPELSIQMYSDIPLTRGLGSSATAIVGGMAAANGLIGSPLSDHDLFQLASAMEKHPDNVGASLFGGIVAAFWDGEQAQMVRIEPDSRLEVLVAIPEFELSTEKARRVLPEKVSMRDAVFNVGHAAVLVAALSGGELDKIRYAMKDALHQPYRSSLVPGMDRILAEADRHGALGVALSGAGPTLLAFADSREPARKPELERFLLDAFRTEGVPATAMWLAPCSEGARRLTAVEHRGTFIETIKGEVRA